MLRRLFFLFIAAVFSFLVLSAAGAADSNKDRVVKIMTRNMDAGTDFYLIFAALKNPSLDLFAGNTKTYVGAALSNIPARADLIAAEIQAIQPDIVALQEVTKLTTENCCLLMQPEPMVTISQDAFASLLTGLDQRGLHYSVLASQTNTQLGFMAWYVTPGAWDWTSKRVIVNFSDSDVILVRDDLRVSDFKLENTQQGHFANTLTIPGFPGAFDTFIRGWISLDAKLRGKTYRFITTHLEGLSPDVQAAQTNELLAGPLNTDLPVILAGDLNSDAYAPSWAHGPAYGMLTAAGFSDAWSELYPGVAGFTWPMHLEDGGLNAGPLQRMDLILTKGDELQPRDIVLTGASPSSFPTDHPDHAGVVGSLVLLP